MANEGCGTDMLGRLAGWIGHGADHVFEMFNSVRLLRWRWCSLGHATSWTTYLSVALDCGARSLSYIIRPRFVIAALVYAALAVDGDAGHRGHDTSHPIRVMIVDDHPIVRQGIKLSLRSTSDFEVVGEASSGEEALDLLEQAHPDVILMDLVMPGMGGVPAIRAITEMAPDVKVIVLTSYEEGDLVQETLQAGAIGYQLKSIDIDELLNTIRLAVSGVPSLAPAAAQSLVQVTKTARKLGDDLTDREREVLALLAQGLSNPAIADKLVISKATVKFHVHNICSKLGTTNRMEAVVVAMHRRLVPSER